MKSDDTTILNRQDENEETQLKNNQQETVETGQNTTPKSDKKNSVNWKEVAIGGVSGILLGGASVIFSGAVSALDDPDAPQKENEHDDHGTPISPDSHITVDGLQVADNVTDDMSFSEAFAAARADVGAGGVFEWHGGVYGTYYANEWNSMTPEQRAEFGSHISYGATSTTASTSGQHPTETSNQSNEHHQTADTNHTTDTHQSEEHQPATQQQHSESVEVVEVEHPSDNGVQILGIHEATLENGTEVTMGQLAVEGQDVIVVDIDQDGTFDALIVDANGDGQIDSNEIQDIQGDGLTVDALQQQMDAQDAQINNYLADDTQPDYINDADATGFSA